VVVPRYRRATRRATQEGYVLGSLVRPQRLPDLRIDNEGQKVEFQRGLLIIDDSECLRKSGHTYREHKPLGVDGGLKGRLFGGKR
jgi:hypothetical protein